MMLDRHQASNTPLTSAGARGTSRLVIDRGVHQPLARTVPAQFSVKGKRTGRPSPAKPFSWRGRLALLLPPPSEHNLAARHSEQVSVSARLSHHHAHHATQELQRRRGTEMPTLWALIARCAKIAAMATAGRIGRFIGGDRREVLDMDRKRIWSRQGRELTGSGTGAVPCVRPPCRHSIEVH